MSIITLADYVSTNTDHIALPDYTELGVESVENIVLSFDQIHIDDITGNVGKVDTHTGAEIEQLRLSFADGVDSQEFPPAVYYRGANFSKPYVLVYGYGRSEAIRALGQTEWIFTLFAGTPEQMEDVQAQENEGYPKRLNKEVDMRKHLSRKVANGRIKNTEKAITAEFIRIYGKTRDKTCRNRVVKMVMEAADTPQPYILYTSVPKVQDWVSNHSSVEHVIGGEFSEETNSYGVCIGEGYQYRVIMQAVNRYMETGKFTNLIGHVGAPTSKATLEIKRKRFVDQLNTHRQALEYCGLTTFPVRLLGFLPQEQGKESLKQLVKYSLPNS